MQEYETTTEWPTVGGEDRQGDGDEADVGAVMERQGWSRSEEGNWTREFMEAKSLPVPNGVNLKRKGW